MSIHVCKWWSLFFFCLSNLLHLCTFSFSTFSLTWKFHISSPLLLYRHVIVMYHPFNTSLPIDPYHCGHFDSPNASVTVILSQGSGVVKLAHCGSAGHQHSVEPNPTKFVTPELELLRLLKVWNFDLKWMHYFVNKWSDLWNQNQIQNVKIWPVPPYLILFIHFWGMLKEKLWSA